MNQETQNQGTKKPTTKHQETNTLFQVRESPTPLNIPTHTPSPDHTLPDLIARDCLNVKLSCLGFGGGGTYCQLRESKNFLGIVKLRKSWNVLLRACCYVFLLKVMYEIEKFLATIEIEKSAGQQLIGFSTPFLLPKRISIIVRRTSQRFSGF